MVVNVVFCLSRVCLRFFAFLFPQKVNFIYINVNSYELVDLVHSFLTTSIQSFLAWEAN